MWFLGMDVGTGGTRAVVVDATGKLISGASSEHAPFRTPHPGWAEQDPEDWWRAAQEAIRAALAAAPEPRQPIAAIGLTGQMHGAVMLDENGVVLRPSLIWCDTRTQPECDWLHAKIGYERLIELTCNPALPNFTLTKLLWVKEARAGDLRQDPPHHVPQGLCALPAHRRVCHRRAGSLGNTAAGRDPSPLVERSGRGGRDSRELAPEGLRIA